MPKITNKDEARAYFETPEPEARSILACRATLRVVANLALHEEELFDGSVLTAFHATLLSMTWGFGRYQDAEWLQSSVDALSATVSTEFDDALLSLPILPPRTALDLSANPLTRTYVSAVAAAKEDTLSAVLFSADASDQFHAFAAFSADSEHTSEAPAKWNHFQNKPVWPSFEGVEHIEATHDAFLKRLALSSDWNWWRQWYEQMWHGTFTDWNFALEVAKIDWDAPEGESVWDEGPAAVAARIEELQRNRNGEPHFDETLVKDRVNELLKNSNAAASMAESAAALILKGIADYKRKAPANGLPDGLELLEELPAHFSQIAEALRKDGPQATREEELEAEIKRLNSKLGKLEAEAARQRALGAVFREEWVRGMAKTLSDKWFVGGMCFGTAYFFGVDVSDFTLENLRGYISELMEAEPADQRPESPPKPVDT
ncbi:MAG: hypothetical protein AAGA47_09015 [Pseudomonadota bacterium]